MLASISGGASFVYDGDGKRVKKTDGGSTIFFVNQYYEKNLNTREETTYYYLGSKLVAQRQGTTLSYIQQDSLSSTSVTSDTSGAATSTIRYYPYGECLESQGSIVTDKRFTGQRLDSTGLYYYGARYYDPTIGRFISADTIVPNPNDPQSLNRYSYCLNNPLRYIDPSGHDSTDYWMRRINDYANGGDGDGGQCEGMAGNVTVTSDNGDGGYVITDQDGNIVGHVSDYWDTKAAIKGYLRSQGKAYCNVDGGMEGIGSYVYSISSPEGPTHDTIEQQFDEAVMMMFFGYVGARAFALYRGPISGISFKSDPLKGVKYQPRVLERMGQDNRHGFPEKYDSLAVKGTGTITADRCGRPQMSITTYGYNEELGKWGTFEWGINYKNELFHRFFRAD